MRADGQWNPRGTRSSALDPGWTHQYFAIATPPNIYSGVLPAKDIELLSIAFDAAITHMYAPGTRRHIAVALKLGVTIEEIMEVLKICVVHGTQTYNLGVPILAEGFKRAEQATAGKK